jgi:hypothetical protein
MQHVQNKKAFINPLKFWFFLLLPIQLSPKQYQNKIIIALLNPKQRKLLPKVLKQSCSPLFLILQQTPQIPK